VKKLAPGKVDGCFWTATISTHWFGGSGNTMSEGIARILIGLIVALAVAYWMWKLPGSNKRYIILAMIGFAIILAAISMAHLSEPFRTLSLFMAISGACLGFVSLYKNYKCRTFFEQSKRKS
jgi:hypothetical protein